MDKQGTYGVWTGWGSQQAWLWTLWPAAVLLCLSSEFFYSFAQGWGQAPRSSLSRKWLLRNPECSSRRKRPSATKSSSMIWLSPPLCRSAPSLRIKELCGNTIPDSDLWVIPVLNPVWVSGLNFLLVSLVATPGGRETAMWISKDQENEGHL